MQYSDYYNLRKPQMAETASVNDLNYNTDRIDAIMADNRQISVAMYVSGNTYNTGDLVGYENAQHRIHIYKCLEDNVTGSWDATKWDITTLADEVLEAKASGGTEVEANPTGTPTDTLETIGIDGVVYGIEGGGGGGTTVVPNPQGEPTDTLETIQIGQTIFDIAGSGGGSYTETTLWSGEQASASGGVLIQLSGSISEFDAIIIEAGRAVGGVYRQGYVWYPTSKIAVGQAFLQILNTNDNASIYWTYTSDTSITWASAYSAYPVTLLSVTGVKFGGGGNIQPVIYSLEEREVGVWTDGKPLYQKTYNITGIFNVVSNAWTNIIELSEMDTLVNTMSISEGVTTDGRIRWRNNSGYIAAAGDVSLQLVNPIITVQYTKTTDTPGSGTWTPQGVPAVHYSTDEQVVGTINGTTLYEKLVTTNGAVPTGATLVLRTPLSNGYDNLQYTY